MRAEKHAEKSHGLLVLSNSNIVFRVYEIHVEDDLSRTALSICDCKQKIPSLAGQHVVKDLVEQMMEYLAHQHDKRVPCSQANAEARN